MTAVMRQVAPDHPRAPRTLAALLRPLEALTRPLPLKTGKKPEAHALEAPGMGFLGQFVGGLGAPQGGAAAAAARQAQAMFSMSECERGL